MRVGKRIVGALAALATVAAMGAVAGSATAAGTWNTLSATQKRSSYGYFVWKSENATTQAAKDAAAKAADILVNAPKKSYTSIGASTDATSLENFQAAVEDTARINDFRAAQSDEPCRTDLASGKGRACGDAGKRLQPLVVTDILMAIAQSDANYSKTFANGHAQQYNVYENLSWAGNLVYKDGMNQYFTEPMKSQFANCKDGQSFAACNWYWTEKPLYNKNPADGGAGHYRTLTDKNGDGSALVNLTYTGVAVNSAADHGNVVAQVYSNASFDSYNKLTAPTYTASAYLADVKAYIAKVNQTAYTVTFDSNGGSAVTAVKVNGGDKLAKPTDPTKAGYTFGGWYTDKALSNAYDFTKAVTGNLTLYAKWNAVTITSVANPAAVSTPAGVNPTSKLPKTVTATYSDGSTKTVNVAWDAIPANSYAKVGSFTVNGTVNGYSGKATITVNVTAAEPVSAVANPATVTTVATNAPDLSKVKATVTYTDGSTQSANVTWPAIDASKYAQPGTFTVKGTAAAGSKTFEVTLTVTVTARTITKVTAPAAQTVDSGKEPTYPTQVDVVYNDGKTGKADVTWTKLTRDQYGKRDGGTFDVTGTVAGYNGSVKFTVTVNKAVPQSAVPTAATEQTTKDVVPDLSGIKANITWSNGDKTEAAVTWPELTASQFATVGDKVPVKGTVSVDGKSFDVTVTVSVVSAIALKATIPTGDNGVNVTVESGTSPAAELAKIKATVTWSNDETTDVAVTWDAPKKADYSLRAGGVFSIAGTVNAGGKTFDVTAKYKVKAATVKSAAIKGGSTVTTASGTAPKLPTTAVVTWSNGDTIEGTIRWTTINKTDYSKRAGGTFDVTGTVDSAVTGADKLTVTAQVTVNAAEVKSVEEVAVSTLAKVAPNLPGTVKVTWSNDDVVDETVAWDAVSAEQYAKRGVFKVNGVATDPETGVKTNVTATVTVTATISSVTQPEDITVESGQDPARVGKLPTTVTVVWSDGDSEDVAVTWDTASYGKADYSKREGNTFVVKGAVKGYEHGVSVTVKVKPATVKSVEGTETDVNTVEGAAPALPEVLTVNWSNGDVSYAKIAWPAVDASAYAKAGSFTVRGSAAVAGKTYETVANVTVKAKSTEQPGGNNGGNNGAGNNGAGNNGSGNGAGNNNGGAAVSPNPPHAIKPDLNKKPGSQLNTGNTIASTGATVAIIAVVVVVLAAIGGVALVIARKRGNNGGAGDSRNED
ncbi:Ig-like domain-containing protein [Bifidobacterium jacchi]|nr:Ig-like domain-containing protein [Bifidobacterium jacchi]